MSEEISRGERILDDYLDNAGSADAENQFGLSELEACKAKLSEKEKELEIVTNQLLQLREELKKAKTSPVLQGSENEWKKQIDGQPRAGIIPKQIAEDNGMMELMPNSGIFVYPKDIRVVSKKTNGTAIARYLMSVFYTNNELVTAGNLTGANGKGGLNKQVAKAIIDYAVIKGKDLEASVKLSMRTKISALVSFEKKKAVNTN